VRRLGEKVLTTLWSVIRYLTQLPSQRFPLMFAVVKDIAAGHDVMLVVRCSTLVTVGLRDSTRLQQHRDSTKDCSKSCIFNHFRLAVLNM
jgi:hypothetical protein